MKKIHIVCLIITASFGLPVFADSNDDTSAVRLESNEIKLVQEKRDAILKYLQEEELLKDAKAALKEHERQKAYDNFIEQNKSVDPETIVELRKILQELEKARNAPIAGPVVQKIKTISLDLNDATPVDLHVAKGYASSIVLFDATGQPWPASGDVIGDPTSFKSHPTNENSSVIAFEIMKEFSESNALLNLKGLHAPIVLRLIGSDNIVDSRLSIRIPKDGPLAKPVTSGTPQLATNDTKMLNILSGQFDALSGSERYMLSGVNGEVIENGGELYVRSEHKLVIPPAKQAVTGPTGMSVFRIAPTQTLTFSVDGRLVDASVVAVKSVNVVKSNSVFETSK